MTLDSTLINTNMSPKNAEILQAENTTATTMRKSTLLEFSSSPPFPVKLHRLLEDASRLGFDDIVCWQPGGTCFKVLQPDRFADEIMQKYFQQTKYKSFQRQINTYGFQRVHLGPMKGSYTHPMFTRENPNFQMARQKTKQSRTKKKIEKRLSEDSSTTRHATRTTGTTLPQTHFDSFLWSLVDDEVSSCSTSSSDEDEEEPFFLPFSGGDDEISLNEMDDMLSKFLPTKTDDPDAGGLPSSSAVDTIATILPPSTRTATRPSQQSWKQKCDSAESQAATADRDLVYQTQERKDMKTAADSSSTTTNKKHHNYNFPHKLHMMLGAAEREHFSDVVSWVKDGTAFKVHKRKDFVEKIMPNYFDQTQFESFRRQLNIYGFSRISKGKERGVVSHILFVKGQYPLCDRITRVGKPIGAR